MNIKEIFGDLQNLGADFMGGGFFKSVGKEVGNAIFGADTEEAENIANDVGTVDKAVSKLGDTTEKTSTKYNDSWGSIIGKTSEANSSISETLNSNVAKLDETILKTDELKNNTQTNWDEIRGVYTTSTDEIKGKTDEVTNKITESMGTMTTLTGESLNTFNQANFKTWEDVVAETSKASTEIKGKTNEVKFNVTNMSLGVKSCVPNITSFTSAFMSSFSALNDSVYRICEGINQKIGNMFQNVVNQTNNANNIAQQMQNNNNTNTNWNPNRVRNFGYANGGTPKSGSIFYANENGNTELVGNFGGYSGVANQDMIIQAIKEAAVQNSNGTGTVINNNFNIGNMLGTDADFRKLVNKVTQVQRQQNHNIANGSFVMA
jgi:hypothetical protein